MLPPARKPIRGTGRAHLQAFGKDAIFSELSFTYPLKLISPKILGEDVPPVAIAYILSYGGGLISSDRIDISFEVGPRAILMLLTQVSNKRSSGAIYIESNLPEGIDKGLSRQRRGSNPS